MRTLSVFVMVTLDGYFEGPNHDINWHNVDADFNKFANRQLEDADMLVFGRKTFELMESFWPTERAQKSSPVTAKLMTDLPKIVVSTTRKNSDWNNTRFISKNIKEEIQKLKEESGKDILIMASSNLCVSLIEMGLIDEFRIMVNPVSIGSGTPLFQGLKENLKLKLISTKTFSSGNILLIYRK